MRATPRSAAFDGVEALTAIRAPTLVVGSHDEIDPDHPLAVAQEYARRIPGAQFAIEAEGEAPLTWRGGALSRTIIEFLAEIGSGGLASVRGWRYRSLTTERRWSFVTENQWRWQ